MEQQEKQIVTFSLGKGEYGIDVEQVREVVTYRECTKIPKVPSFISGLMNLRGQVVLVVNLREFLDISSEEEVNSKTVIIIDAPKRNFGFLVEEVFGVTRLSAKDIEPPPVSSQDIIKGIFKKGEDLVMIMDAHRVMELLEKMLGDSVNVVEGEVKRLSKSGRQKAG